MKHLVFGLTLLLTVVASAVQAAPAALQGAWIANSYQPHGSQVRFDLRGQMQFSGSRWSLTYIVLTDGKPQRVFAQVGRFSGEGDKLDLYGDVALYPYAPAVPGLWEQRERYIVFPQDGVTDPVKAEFTIEGDQLTMIFGVGSKMIFTRAR